MSEENTLLLSVPIRELTIDLLDPQYFPQVQWYLEHELGCAITYMSGGAYFVRFPEGTVEETHRGRSTQWTRETTIRLPSGVTLRKLDHAPLNATQRQRVGLAFPHAILDVPLPARRVAAD